MNFGPGFGVGDGLVAAEGVAEAEAASVKLQRVGDGLAGIGAGGVFGIGPLDAFAGRRTGPGQSRRG
jgi:hypothetical protein